MKEKMKSLIKEKITNNSENAYSIVNMKSFEILKSGFDSREKGYDYIKFKNLDSDIFKVIKNDFLDKKQDIIYNFKHGK
jgi:hypothetical protein